MPHATASRRPLRRPAVRLYRLASALLALALSLPPGAIQASPARQAGETPPPDASPTPTLPPPASPTGAEARLPTATPTPPAGTEAPTPPGTPAPPTATPSPTPAATTSDPDLPDPEAGGDAALEVSFSADPDQALTGETVTYRVTLTNAGAGRLSNLAFTNSLPDGLVLDEGSLAGAAYDHRSRTLRWALAALPAGETVTLEYAVRLTGLADYAWVEDTATVTADELPAPLLAAARLTTLPRGQRVASVGPAGGRAIGLDGRVAVNLPPGAVPAFRAVVIRDLTATYPAPRGQAWAAFGIEVFAEAGRQAGSGQGESDQRVRLGPAEPGLARPAELTVAFDGLADLARLGAEHAPFVVSLDEASGTWVRVPLARVDQAANTVTVAAGHFSTWGAGIGPAFPENGANVLLFDSAQPDLFTGRARFSLPIWTPPGRNGLAPSLALAYSSGTADGVLGDAQAPWTGWGWSLGTAEIARRVTNGPCDPCGAGYYGYENEFVLVFNGTGGELIPDGTSGRYHTKDERFLYIQRHNDALGTNAPAAPNATGEWWEVVTRDGTRWRLGFTADAEQRAAMRGYPGAATGSWEPLGYAGHALDVVALRWRADRVTDTHGNLMEFHYAEATELVDQSTEYYDRASYLEAVTFTDHLTDEQITPAYSVVFVREPRPAEVQPDPLYDWDNWDSERLDRIEVRYGTQVVRTYDLTFAVRSYSDGEETWDTTVLESVAASGGATTAPTVTFTYADLDNRDCQSGCDGPRWAYPRLQAVANGWGATATFTYNHDGRTGSESWYHWRVEALAVTDGLGGTAARTAWAYSGPCYQNDDEGWCNAGQVGELVGYAQTTVTRQDFDGAPLAVSVHRFHTDEQRAGREYETRHEDEAGGLLAKTVRTFAVVTEGLPEDGFFTYAESEESFVWWGAALARIRRTEYTFDAATGNLTREAHFDGRSQPATLYRATEHEYATNPDPAVWILDRVRHTTLTDAAGAAVAETWYTYDEPLLLGELRLEQQVDHSTGSPRTVDRQYIYDAFGNRVETRAYEAYGTVGVAPSGAYRKTTATFNAETETGLPAHTYLDLLTQPLGLTTDPTYDYARGLPQTVADANGQVTTTTYDGLGRVATLAYPGYATGQENVIYSYPTPPAPFGLELRVRDEAADGTAVYRSAWTIYDGLGRALQAQGPDEAGTGWAVTDTAYDALGRVRYRGLPRAVSGAGGAYAAPNWWAVKHTTTSYDALGRAIEVAYPDGTRETTAYDGLRTTLTDRNGHRRVEQSDSFGRLARVEEYTGDGPYTLYAVTTYTYDKADRLIGVTDAQGNVTTITYDDLGRKTAMDDPDMGAWRYAYLATGELDWQTDARGHRTCFYYDGLGRLTGKHYRDDTDCPASPTLDATYTYDAGPNALGRRSGMATWAGGAETTARAWEYNALGQVTTETWRVGGTEYIVQASYDAFGRLLTQTYPADPLGNEVVTYTYNATGALERLTSSRGDTYVQSVTYNASGQMTAMLVGEGITTTYAYDPLSQRLTSALSARIPEPPLLDLAYEYDAGGNVTAIRDGTRAETAEYGYDALDRLTSAEVRYGLAAVYRQAYSYDRLGNLVAVGRWPAEPSPYTHAGSFGGAALAGDGSGSRNRVTGLVGAGYADEALVGWSVSPFVAGGLAAGPAGPAVVGRGSVASGAVAPGTGSRGSVTAFSGGSGGLPFTRGGAGYVPPPPTPEPAWTYTDFAYGQGAGPHAVTGASGATSGKYIYDANGNMTERVEEGVTYTQVFDAENRLVAVTAGAETMQFVYDADGALVQKANPNGTANVYVGGLYEERRTAAGGVALRTRYYAAAGAVRAGSTLTYVLADHLGSATVAVSPDGATVRGERRYFPFGETRDAATSGLMPSDRLYTGQRALPGLGLYHFGARFYAPGLGRFISADTVVPEPGNPQALNRYSYSFNGPMRYTDPSGHSPCDDRYWPTAFEEAHGRPPTSQDYADCVLADKIAGLVPNGELTQDYWQALSPAEKLTYIATVLDMVAAGFNLAAAFLTDAASIIFPPAYPALLEVYQAYMIVPNSVSTASMLLWIIVDVANGATRLTIQNEEGEVTVSGSLGQDSLVAIVTNVLGWTVIREPNVATVVDATVALYDLYRIPNDVWTIPTVVAPSFSWRLGSRRALEVTGGGGWSHAAY